MAVKLVETGVEFPDSTVQTTKGVSETRNISSGDGITGGGDLGSDLSLSVDGTVVRTSRTISSGSGLTGGGDLGSDRTISHDNTSSQGSVNNSGSTVIQDVSLDSFGHVTNLNSKSLTASDIGALDSSATASDIGALGVNQTASDSDRLNGVSSFGYLRSNTSDTFTGIQLTINNDLSVNGNIDLQSGSSIVWPTDVFLNSSNTDSFSIVWNDSSGWSMDFQDDRNIVVYDGNTAIFSTDTSISDKRHKKNIVDTDQGLNVVNQIRVVDFMWRKDSTEYDNEKIHTGVIAQEVESVVPDAVKEFENNYIVNRDRFVPYLIKAVQELSEQVNTLQNEIKELKNS